MKRLALLILTVPALGLGLKAVATPQPTLTPHGEYLEARSASSSGSRSFDQILRVNRGFFDDMSI